MKITLISILTLGAGLLSSSSGAPVINWVTTNGDALFSGGSESTNSPITTDADADTIVGSFPEVILKTGQSITLTGSILVSGQTGPIPGNQIRWGLFDAPGTPTSGEGENYVGIWTSSNNGPADIRSADGSTINPFSSSAATVISTVTNTEGMIRYDETLVFSLTITRIDDFTVSTTASLTNGDDFSVEWPQVESPASPTNFTYDSVGILLGGTTDATMAALSDIEVSVSEKESEIPIITGLTIDPTSGDITLTWSSRAGLFYSVDSSTNLMAWPINIDDAVEASSDNSETSLVIPADQNDFGDRIFFRVSIISL